MPLAAIDDDLMPACSQPCRKLFGESLESSIAGGDPASAEDRESHLRRNQPRAARAFARVRAVGLGAGRLTGW